MYLLLQDTKVYDQEITSGKATAAIISNVPVIPDDPLSEDKLISICDELLDFVTVYQLDFSLDKTFLGVLEIEPNPL